MLPINKLSGIYQIKNNINNKIYIGHSINLTLRWYSHIDNLMKNIHPNHKLQEDYNKYGLLAFDFNILELVEGKSNLIKKEQEYLEGINFDENYNLINSIADKDNEGKIDEFINYINNKWLAPKGITDRNKLNEYKIYKKEDKKNIIEKAIEYNILNTYRSLITFNRIIKFMENTLGYTIENGRINIKKKKHTYKLVVDFDEDYIDERKDNII